MSLLKQSVSLTPYAVFIETNDQFTGLSKTSKSAITKCIEALGRSQDTVAINRIATTLLKQKLPILKSHDGILQALAVKGCFIQDDFKLIQKNIRVKFPKEDIEIKNLIENASLAKIALAESDYANDVDIEILFQEKAEILRDIHLGRCDAKGYFDLVILVTSEENLGKKLTFKELYPLGAEAQDIDAGDIERDGQVRLQEAIRKINQAQKAGKRVLVCCQQGKDRSPMVLAAFLMWKYGVTAERAANYLALKRPIVAFHAEPQEKDKEMAKRQYWTFLTKKFDLNFAPYPEDQDLIFEAPENGSQEPLKEQIKAIAGDDNPSSCPCSWKQCNLL